MTDIKWGPEVAVNGTRPEWLRDGDRVVVNVEKKGGEFFGEFNGTTWHGHEFFEDWERIKLRSDHPHYSKDDAPDWAIEDALRRSGYRGRVTPIMFKGLRGRSTVYHRAIMSFAELIAKHEQPPMDEVDRFYQEGGNCGHEGQFLIRAFLKWQKEQG